MTARTKKKSGVGDLVISGALEILELAVPVSKAIPLVGNTLEGALEAVLYIIKVKDEVKMKKEKCQMLAERVLTITAAITGELLKSDEDTLRRRENNVADLRWTLREVKDLLDHLRSASLIRRILERGEVDHKLEVLHQKLNNAIDVFHITENMRTEEALKILRAASEEAEDKQNNILINSLLRPVPTAGFVSRQADTGCFPGTRQMFLNKIYTWFSNSQGPQIFWLSGLGGTGKTAISHTVCKALHSEGHLGASFFFSRDEADRRRVAFTIPTIAFQLAAVNLPYRRKLVDVLREHPDAAFHAQQSQMTELLLEPLKKVPSLGPYLIVLDALDECDKERGVEGGDLVPLLLRELPRSGLNIKVLITSRPERSIQNIFKSANLAKSLHESAVLHEMDQSAIQDDIKSYLTHHLQQIQITREVQPPWPEWPGSIAFNELVLRAGLFFIFAATIVKTLADTLYSPRDRLQRLLGNMNTPSTGLYSQILQSFVENRGDALELCERFRKIVGSIIVLQNPLSVSALGELLEHDEDDIEGALTPLHSLLVISPGHNQPIRIFHPSFRDFLVIQNRCTDPRFMISEGQVHSQLASCCLTIMLHHLKRNICNIGEDVVLNSEIPDLQKRLQESVSPALSYACQHWGYHLSHSDVGGSQRELAKKMSAFASTKLLYWIEVLSLEQRFPLCVSNLLAVFSWCKNNIPNTYNMVYDAYRLVLDFHNAISISAIQVYNSALLFIPNCSILHKYKHELPTYSLKSPRTENWDASLLVLEGHTSTVNMISLSPNGGRAASASDDGYICIWDISDGSQVVRLSGHDGAVKSVGYSPDTAFLVSSGADSSVRLWEAVTGSEIFKFLGHTDCVRTAIFSNKGNTIASGSDDSTLALWDVQETKQLALLTGHSASVTCLLFSSDNCQIFSGSEDCTIRVWDVEAHNVIRVLQCADAVVSLALNSTTLFSASKNGVITLRGAEDEISYLFDGEATINSLSVLSRDGVDQLVSGSSDGIVRIWDLSGSKSWIAKYRGHSGPVECIRPTSDGLYILSASVDRTIRLWDATMTGVQGSEEFVMVVQIPENIDHIASGSTHGKIALWNTDDGSLVYEVNAHSGSVLSLSFSNNDKLIASSSVDQTICILNSRDGSNFALLKGHTDEVYTAQFSADDSLLVSASPDSRAIIWDVVTHRQKYSLVHNSGVGVASFSSDDKLICSGTLDGEIHIWNVETGERITILKGNPDPMPPILWALFSPDGAWLVSWLEDESIKVWKVLSLKFEPWLVQDWRLDSRADNEGIIAAREGKTPARYEDLLPDDELHYLQEDGWITFPHTGKRVCWVPASRRQPWLRTLWESQKGIFATGSQAVGTKYKQPGFRFNLACDLKATLFEDH
ncbi:WD40-repeat-containing domain protein [Favolaschia claudopus]|uniref:WD40-repeat-containing domain protein n=1 Tax=Favolaschia claudopus TaxID=2862362 RepID=A0AAV9ZYP3_9AGAR